MAITNYTGLVSAVRDWLGRSNDTVYLTDDRIADCIRFAESDIFERLRVKEMESFDYMTVDAQSEALPSGCIGIRRAYVDTDPIVELQYMAPPQFWGTFSQVITGKPWAYTQEGELIVYGPTPDQTYTVKILYWKRLDALSPNANPNFLFQRQPDLWLYGTLAHACVFTQDDERLATFKGAFAEAMDRADGSNEKSRWSGSPLVVRPG